VENVVVTVKGAVLRSAELLLGGTNMKIVALCRVLVKTKKLSPLAAKSDHVTSDEMAKNRS